MSTIIEIHDPEFTFSEGDDGNYYRVFSACCLKIPHSDTYDFQIFDRLYIKNVTDDIVDIIGEENVIINSTGTKLPRDCFALFIKVADNEWDEIGGSMVSN